MSYEKERVEAEHNAYRKHAKDYVDALAQFGADRELKATWFHSVGFYAGADWATERERKRSTKLVKALDSILDETWILTAADRDRWQKLIAYALKEYEAGE